MGVFCHSRHGSCTNKDLTFIFNEFKLANAKEKQVCGHFWCLPKGYELPVVSQVLLSSYGSIGYGNELIIDNHLHIKSRLLGWMVKARKGAPCVTLFKLCYGTESLLAFSAVPASVKTSHPIIYLAQVGDV
ncbi:hypothetical protein ES703_116734 [subsurface metagenome]